MNIFFRCGYYYVETESRKAAYLAEDLPGQVRAAARRIDRDRRRIADLVAILSTEDDEHEKKLIESLADYTETMYHPLVD